MNAFYQHHKDNILFHYGCFDRILLNGLIQPFQQPERVVGFFSAYIAILVTLAIYGLHRYVLVYLAIWMATYSLWAMKNGQVGDYLAGITAGIKQLPQLQRQPLGLVAIGYLQSHYGRLWY